MESKVRLLITHKHQTLIEVEKGFSLPYGFCSEGIKTSLRLTSQCETSPVLYVDEYDTEQSVALLSPIKNIDFSELSKEADLTDFVEGLKAQQWSVNLNEELADRIIHPSESMDSLDVEQGAPKKQQKPKIQDALLTLVFSALVILAYKGFSMGWELQVKDYLNSVLQALLGTAIGFWFSVLYFRKKNKSHEKLIRAGE